MAGQPKERNKKTTTSSYQSAYSPVSVICTEIAVYDKTEKVQYKPPLSENRYLYCKIVIRTVKGTAKARKGQ